MNVRVECGVCRRQLECDCSAPQEERRTTFRIVRHGENGARETLAEGVAIPSEDAAEMNRALVRTAYRLWPVKGTP